jgi:hypothetical protein
MNYKERMLSVIKGETAGHIPFVPRLDLWYKANKLSGTLPYKYRNADIMDIVEDLDIGYHAAVPDFKEYDREDCDVDLGLGIYRFKTIPYDIELNNIKRIVRRENNGLLKVEYVTPYGSIKTGVVYDESAKKAGATISSTVEHALKGVGDLKAASYIFDNMEVKPKYDGYAAFKEYIGDRGIAVGFCSLSASPMHHIQKELMPLDVFVYNSYDYPDEMNEMAKKITRVYDEICRIVAGSPAEVVLSGANYDSSVTSPPFFREYIAGSLKAQSEKLHEKGKYLLTHTDGENKGLLDMYIDSGIDIADSICPKPMTKLSLSDIREVFKDRITIWGGIPSVCTLENSMSDHDFEIYLDKTMDAAADKKRMILSIADTTPPGAKFERILRIAEKAKEI